MFLSVITPTFNSEKNIKKHINSLNKQKKIFEQIIIDNVSKDHTLKIIKKNAEYPLKIIQEKDNGIYDAMNKGIKSSRGDYLLFLNSDDWLRSNILTNIQKFIKYNNQPDIVYSNACFFKTGKFFFKKKAKIKKLNQQMSLFHPSIIFKKKLFKNFNYDQRYKVAADWDLLLKLLNKKNIKIKYFSKFTTNISMGGYSSDLIKSSKDFWNIQRKYNSLILSSFNYLLYYKLNIIKIIWLKLINK